MKQKTKMKKNFTFILITILFFLVFLNCKRRFHTHSLVPVNVSAGRCRGINKLTRKMVDSIEQIKEIKMSSKKGWIFVMTLHKQSMQNKFFKFFKQKDICFFKDNITTMLMRKKIARFLDDTALKEHLESMSYNKKDLYNNKKLKKIAEIIDVKFILRGYVSFLNKKETSRDFRFVFKISIEIIDIDKNERLWNNSTLVRLTLMK